MLVSRNNLVLLLVGAATLLPAGAAEAQRRSAPPKAESETLTTKDGVGLRVKYYPSTVGRDAAPVVLVHDFKESGRAYSRLARRLQRPQEGDTHESFAVVTVDLRGHGDSMKQAYRGKERELESSKLKVDDMRMMVLGDMEAVRRFLVKKNDEGKLNLNRMALVGSGMGALVATNYAANDWTAPRLATVKQGQDVKAMVLISPEWKAKGLSMQNAIRQPDVQSKVAVLMLYGREDRKRARDVDKIYGQLLRGHPTLRTRREPDIATQLQELPAVMKLPSKTKLQGSQLLEQKGDKAEGVIARFLAKHTSSDEFSHSKRRPE